ncbi:MAG: hypothetical protein LT071_10365 [Nocardioides sp.]|nr:hypothetical protein [Nocardioides sp.]
MLTLAALVLATALAGCSGGDPSGRAVDPAGPGTAGGERPTAVPSAEGLVRTPGLVTVLDDGDGPELCAGGVAESYPPQCGGPKLVGWDWAEHPEHERASGVRWGDFHLTGTFDGTSFTVEDVVPAALYDPPAAPEEPTPDTSCPEPAGGWVVVDPGRTTYESMDETFRVAQTLPGYAGAWMDQSINPASTSEDPAVVESEMNDPRKLVINVAVTEDREGAERRLREVWGGALCVVEARYTEAELQRVLDGLGKLPGMLGGGSSRVDSVEVQVLFDDGSIQAWVDEEYGQGLVTVGSALVPAG